MKAQAMLRLFKRGVVLLLAHSVCFMPVVTVHGWWQELCLMGLLVSWLWYDAQQSEIWGENIRKTNESVRRHHKVATAVMDLACDYGMYEKLRNYTLYLITVLVVSSLCIRSDKVFSNDEICPRHKKVAMSFCKGGKAVG